MNSLGIDAICSSTDRLGKLTKSKFWSMAGASSIETDFTIGGIGATKIS